MITLTLEDQESDNSFGITFTEEELAFFLKQASEQSFLVARLKTDRPSPELAERVRRQADSLQAYLQNLIVDKVDEFLEQEDGFCPECGLPLNFDEREFCTAHGGLLTDEQLALETTL